MKLAAICLLLASFHILAFVDIVKGLCGTTKGQSDWFACFKEVDNDCPNGFIKIGDTAYCDRSGFPGEKMVCCLIVPRIQIEVKDSPCLDEPCKTSKSKKTKTREIAQQSIPKGSFFNLAKIVNKHRRISNKQLPSSSH